MTDLMRNSARLSLRKECFLWRQRRLGKRAMLMYRPKDMIVFIIINPTTVAYLDLGGSGIETLAHLRENGRITIMFCAFEGKANILRLYGTGSAVSFDEPGFKDSLALFPSCNRARSIITVNITRITDSCGFGVPFYEFKGERDQLMRSAQNRPEADWKQHRYERNSLSIDGLKGLIKPAK